MRRVAFLLLFFLPFSIFISQNIYEPEGMNMPGSWNPAWPNGWNNPPTNDYFAGVQAESGTGKFLLDTNLITRRYTTSFYVTAEIMPGPGASLKNNPGIKEPSRILTAFDIPIGTYQFLFTSGPSSNYWQNKWANVSVNFDEIQSYTYQGNSDNSVNFITGGWYFVAFHDVGYQNSDGIFMYLGAAEPVDITDVSYQYNGPGNDVIVTANISSDNVGNQKFFIRYTKDNWQTWGVIKMDQSGRGEVSGTIPGTDITGGSGNQFYVFSSTVDVTQIEGLQNWEYDMYTIRYNINNGQNFPLPVELASFSVRLANGIPHLSWRTISETNNYGFEIERKRENGEWEKIGFVKGKGNSNVVSNYEYFDRNANYGKYYYRLKQLDYDGKFEYSNIQSAVISLPEDIVLEQNYPNPFNPKTAIRFSVKKEGKACLKVFDSFGRLIETLFEGFVESEKNYEVVFNAEKYSSGVYFYRLEYSDKILNRKMLYIK